MTGNDINMNFFRGGISVIAYRLEADTFTTAIKRIKTRLNELRRNNFKGISLERKYLKRQEFKRLSQCSGYYPRRDKFLITQAQYNGVYSL